MARPGDASSTRRRARGFEHGGALIAKPLRQAGEKRGFAQARLLTHWADIVGPETAARARPVKVSYAQGGFGATLTLLVSGAHAPLIQAETPKIRERVNACYGYNAISRIRLTQTAPEGFGPGLAEDRATFAGPVRTPPAPHVEAEARLLTAGVADDGLRGALEILTRNVLSRQQR